MDFATYKYGDIQTLQASYLQEEKLHRQKHCKLKETQAPQPLRDQKKYFILRVQKLSYQRRNDNTEVSINIFHLIINTHYWYDFCCCWHTTLLFSVLMHLDFTLISLNFLHFLYILMLFIKHCSISNCCFCIMAKRQQKKAHTEIWRP